MVKRAPFKKDDEVFCYDWFAGKVRKGKVTDIYRCGSPEDDNYGWWIVMVCHEPFEYAYVDNEVTLANPEPCKVIHVDFQRKTIR